MQAHRAWGSLWKELAGVPSKGRVNITTFPGEHSHGVCHIPSLGKLTLGPQQRAFHSQTLTHKEAENNAVSRVYLASLLGLPLKETATDRNFFV